MDKKITGLKQEYMKKEMSTEQLEAMKEAIEMAKRDKEKRKKTVMYRRYAAVAAGLVLALIIVPNTSKTAAYAMSQIPVLGKLIDVVTFRDYQYESDRNKADVSVPELVVNEVEKEMEQIEEGTTKEAATTEQNEETLEKSIEEINAEIQALTEPFIEEFKKNLEYEEGYQDILVKSEVINTTQDYFTLKLICYMGSGSGTEWNYYYTIDLNTGERLLLADLFKENADYITPISENITVQMKEQMAADEMVSYWLDSDIEEWNFKAIKADQDFYLNENGNLVISFNEGDVAPMYMGVVRFTIPDEVIADIRL